MIDPVSDRRPPITPQLALRVAFLGVVAFALFGIVFFRLWYLQVLSGDRYLAEARANRVRVERIQAPRGPIVDRNGHALVENRRATVVTISPGNLPESEREAAAEWGQRVTRRLKRPKGKRGPQVPIPRVTDERAEVLYKRLSHVLGVSHRGIHQRVIQQLAQVPYANVKIKTDVPASMRDYIKERQESFPGVDVEQVYLRRYPHKDLAAQLVGTIGEISPKELELERFRGVTAGTVVGKQGLERTYDRYLRGRDGKTRIQVTALGEPRGTVTAQEPRPGRQLRLSLDLGLQKASEEAMQRVAGGLPGGFVALDPRNGEVLALGSTPSFDPTELSRPISQNRYDELFGPGTGNPQFNRAISGLYPTGSTFKIVPALAGLDAGVIGVDTSINDPGCIAIGAAGQQFCNAGETAYGSVALRRAVQVSSDVYFYTIGRDLNPRDNQPLQAWARRLGYGHRTGIDLPGEFAGNVPDRKWRAEIGKAERDCRRKRKVSSCGISDMRPWSVGDNVNLSVGQGDLQATPLQVAVSYAALANGGRVVRPHLGKAIEDDRGGPLQRLDPGNARRIKLDPGHRQALMDGLRLAASASGGTSADVFKDWKHDRFPIFGKTGTAERVGQEDQSWYVAYSYDSTPERKPIVVAVTVERGGFGAERAAPIARLMLSKWFDQRAKVVVGSSRTR